MEIIKLQEQVYQQKLAAAANRKSNSFFLSIEKKNKNKTIDSNVSAKNAAQKGGKAATLPNKPANNERKPVQQQQKQQKPNPNR